MMGTKESAGRRVVLVHWKNKPRDAFEIFSNLKRFCDRYPAYSYNTLNNYLSKQKIPFESDLVHVERKMINGAVSQVFRLTPVVRKRNLHEIDEGKEDVQYWQSKPACERIAAVTFMISQSLKKGERMDKSIVRKRRLKRYDTRKRL